MLPLVTISREGSVSTETRRAAVTALAGLSGARAPWRHRVI